MPETSEPDEGLAVKIRMASGPIIKVFADGRVEGVPLGAMIENHIPALICAAVETVREQEQFNARCEEEERD